MTPTPELTSASPTSISSVTKVVARKKVKSQNYRTRNSHGHLDKFEEEERQWRRGLQKDVLWAISFHGSFGRLLQYNSSNSTSATASPTTATTSTSSATSLLNTVLYNMHLLNMLHNFPNKKTNSNIPIFIMDCLIILPNNRPNNCSDNLPNKFPYALHKNLILRNRFAHSKNLFSNNPVHIKYPISLERNPNPVRRDPPRSLPRTTSPPSLSPSFSSSLELFPVEPKTGPEPVTPDHPEPPYHPEPLQKLSRRQAKAARPVDTDFSDEQLRKVVALCSVGMEAVGDFQLRKALKPLLELEKVDKKRVCNPINFRGCTHGDHLRLVGWRPYQGRMEDPGHGLPNRHGHKVGGVGAPPIKANVKLLCQEGPHLCSSLSLQIPKGAVPA